MHNVQSRFWIKSFLFLSIIIFISSCSALQDVASTIQKPKLSIQDVRVSDFNFQELSLVYEVKVENTNPAAIQMLGYNYALDVNEHAFLKGEQTQKMEISASDSSSLLVPVTLNFRDLYQTIKGISEKDESTYAFNTQLSFDLPVLGRTEVPVSKNGTIPVVKLPKLKVGDVNVQSLSFSGAKINLQLLFDNPNGFGMKVNNLMYDLEVNEDPWASGTALQNVQIAPNGITELEIPLTLSLNKIGMSAYQILTGSKKANYRVKGTIDFNVLHNLLGNTQLRFDESGEVPIGN